MTYVALMATLNVVHIYVRVCVCVLYNKYIHAIGIHTQRVCMWGSAGESQFKWIAFVLTIGDVV